MSYAKLLRPTATPQNVPVPGKNQVQNAAGGFVFEVSPQQRLARFLVLGSLSGTFYVGKEQLTTDSFDFVTKVASEPWALDLIHEIGTSIPARAPKHDHAVAALAIVVAYGDVTAKQRALGMLKDICRIPTHLFQFLEIYKSMGGGFGRSVQRAIQDWYVSAPANKLAMHLAKYQSRGGWSHRDVLRLARPTPTGEAQSELFAWACKGEAPSHPENTYLAAAHRLLRGEVTEAEAVGLIHDFHFSHEMVPTTMRGSKAIWMSMVDSGGLASTGLLRNLGKLFSLDLTKGEKDRIVARLEDTGAFVKGRVHPMNVFLAQKIYNQGRGDKGSLTWTPYSHVSVALDKLFTSCFGAIEPTGHRYMIGLDISGSMNSPCGSLPITCREASVAMALIPAWKEEKVDVLGFTTTVTPIDFRKVSTIADAVKLSEELARHMGGTDCAALINRAAAQSIPVDVFMLYTDNETWAGRNHPYQALQDYRRKTGINAKLVIHAFTATSHTIGDISDPGTLDLVGLDTSSPQLTREFILGFDRK